MRSFDRKATGKAFGIATAVLGSTALMATPSMAHARPAQRVVFVPCSSSALANAITAANTLPATLRLSARCVYDLTTSATADTALPVITGNVTLAGGPSTTIRRNPAAGAVRLLEVGTTGSLRVQGVFLLNGAPASGVQGGAILDNGSLTLERVTVRGNTTTGGSGGAIQINPGKNAVISHTVLSANIAGANSTGGAIFNSGTLTLSKSRVSANNATNTSVGGGGLFTEGGATSTIVRSTFDHNTATANGGAIHNRGTTSLLRTLVEFNSAGLNGGGIFNLPPGTVTLNISIVRHNTPNNCFPLNTITGCTG